jgi:hypothetical protein
MDGSGLNPGIIGFLNPEATAAAFSSTERSGSSIINGEKCGEAQTHPKTEAPFQETTTFPKPLLDQRLTPCAFM